MARPKKIPTEEQIIEAPVVEVATSDSPAKEKFRALIEAYKVQNPAKYKLKEKELLAKLNNL